MNKSMILLTFVALGSLQVTAETADKGAETFVSKIKSGISQTPSYIKKAGTYLFSAMAAKDLALAYCVGMGLTAIHEGAHAIIAKILTGAPIQLVIGATPNSGHPTYFEIGGVSLGGFNPATGYAYTGYRHRNKPLIAAAIDAAGPICGALASLAVLLLLQKYKGLYITKAAAAYGLFNHTVWRAGVGGAWIPGQDVNRVVSSLRNYRAS